MRLLHSQNHDTYTCGNIVNTLTTNERPSLEKYTSHNLFEMVAKGLRKGYVWEVSWRLNKLQHIDPQFFSSTPFSFCWAAQLGVPRTHSPLLGAGSLYSILSPTPELPVAPGYIIVWHPPASCEHRICTQFNPSTVKVIPWYLRPGAPVPWLTAGSKVNMLHVGTLCIVSLWVWFESRTYSGTRA